MTRDDLYYKLYSNDDGTEFLTRDDVDVLLDDIQNNLQKILCELESERDIEHTIAGIMDLIEDLE